MWADGLTKKDKTLRRRFAAWLRDVRVRELRNEFPVWGVDGDLGGPPIPPAEPEGDEKAAASSRGMGEKELSWVGMWRGGGTSGDKLPAHRRPRLPPDPSRWRVMGEEGGAGTRRAIGERAT